MVEEASHFVDAAMAKGSPIQEILRRVELLVARRAQGIQQSDSCLSAPCSHLSRSRLLYSEKCSVRRFIVALRADKRFWRIYFDTLQCPAIRGTMSISRPGIVTVVFDFQSRPLRIGAFEQSGFAGFIAPEQRRMISQSIGYSSGRTVAARQTAM